MKKGTSAILLFFVLLLAISPVLFADYRVGFSVGARVDLDNYYLAMQRYYAVAPSVIMSIKRRGIADDQIPVVYFLANRAGVSPQEIINLRLDGYSWVEIAWEYNLGADIFYVPVNSYIYGPVYGDIYSYYYETPVNRWKWIDLPDDAVVNMVNLRFVCEHYGYNPYEVIGMRNAGTNFYVINRNFYNDRDRRAHGWRDYNNVWHDRARNWVDRGNQWKARDNYWSNREVMKPNYNDRNWQKRYVFQPKQADRRWAKEGPPQGVNDHGNRYSNRGGSDNRGFDNGRGNGNQSGNNPGRGHGRGNGGNIGNGGNGNGNVDEVQPVNTPGHGNRGNDNNNGNGNQSGDNPGRGHGHGNQ